MRIHRGWPQINSSARICEVRVHIAVAMAHAPVFEGTKKSSVIYSLRLVIGVGPARNVLGRSLIESLRRQRRHRVMGALRRAPLVTGFVLWRRMIRRLSHA